MTAHLTLTAVAVAVLASLTTTEAKAIPVDTFYNTGVDTTHTVLGNGLAETHYVLTSIPNGSAPGVRVATSANGYPLDKYWLGDNKASAWIGPKGDNSLDGAVGQYDYRTTFNLTGFNVSTAVLSGKWAADDVGVNILINGVSTAQPGTGSYSAFTNFSVASGFINGINTIDFIVKNTGGPTGLRVEGALKADVPEPMSLAILGAGLFSVGLIRHRRA